MAVLVIGGSGRGAGKTAVGCALIAAMPELQWVAVKVSPHDHDVVDPIQEEADTGSEKNTGRYLRAGARRAFLVSPSMELSAEALLLEIRARAEAGMGLVIESNRVAARSVAELDESTISLAVLSQNYEDGKPSLMDHISRSDALIFSGTAGTWKPAAPFSARPVFWGNGESWAEPDLVRFVRTRLFADQKLSSD